MGLLGSSAQTAPCPPAPCHLVLQERWVQWGHQRQAGSGSLTVASLLALMNSPDPGPVARPAQGRAAAFPTYFPSGFTRGGSWAIWGRPHVSWPKRLLPGGAPGAPSPRPQPLSPSLARLPDPLVWWERELAGAPAQGSGQEVPGRGAWASISHLDSVTKGREGDVRALEVPPSPVLILAV